MSSSGEGAHARSSSPLEISDTEDTAVTEGCIEDCAPSLSKKARRSAQSGRETTKESLLKMMMSCREERERQHQERENEAAGKDACGQGSFSFRLA